MSNNFNKIIFPVFVLVVGLILAGCDGRYRKYKSNVDVLTEHQLLDSFSEQMGYIPEGPTQIVTDTLLHTGFHIKVQYRALEHDYVLKTESLADNTTKTIYHKNFEAKIKVLKHGKTLLNRIINKSDFFNPEEVDFWKGAIMQCIWVDDETATKHSVRLNTSFRIPNTTTFKDYAIIIYDNGMFKIKETTPYINSI